MRRCSSMGCELWNSVWPEPVGLEVGKKKLCYMKSVIDFYRYFHVTWYKEPWYEWDAVFNYKTLVNVNCCIFLPLLIALQYKVQLKVDLIAAL